MELALAILALALAAVPAALFACNLPLFRQPPLPAGPLPAVSVLIPARDEEAAIAAAVAAALASRGVALEVVVLDDQSQDGTAAVVRSLAAADPRVRLIQGEALPPGWCGKQYACWRLSQAARHDLLCWIDADVRLQPEGLARAVGHLLAGDADLVSGFPRQITGSFLERLLIPLIHFVLLGFLPLAMMRRSGQPQFGAGCGQWFLARRQAYQASGGHAAIRGSLHDGLQLPRAFRRAGFRTDLFDATDLASCRMYHDAAQVWRGLGKNATEGMATPAAIGVWTLLLLGGQVLPVVLLAVLLLRGSGWQSDAALGLALLATALGLAVRLAAAARFAQSWLGALLHPLGVTLLLLIQYQALLRKSRGRPAAWRGRAYAAG